MSPLALPMTILAVLLLLVQACAGVEERRVGGRCEYARVGGDARITSVVARDDGLYEVRFLFIPRDRIDAHPLLAMQKEHLLLKDDFSYPNGYYLRSNGIVNDKVFKCNVRVITRGACTPIIFEFPTMSSGNGFTH